MTIAPTGKPRVIRGPAYVLGDNIDTDQIIPAEYLNLVPTIPEEYTRLGGHALAGLPAGLPPFVDALTGKSPYPIVIAGANFGCGSSREHAPVALGAAGVRAVIARSYARIFFRNAVATGELYPIESEEGLGERIPQGARVELDLDANRLTCLDDGKVYRLKPLGAVQPVVDAGGIFGYARSTGMMPGADARKP
jgi:3-isopropylmalate/(R)-2-methylmalate dehydratase small subunit